MVFFNKDKKDFCFLDKAWGHEYKLYLLI